MFNETAYPDVFPASIGADISVAGPGPNAISSVLAEEETGSVFQLYREIARRIPRNAFTPHESTLGKMLG